MLWASILPETPHPAQLSGGGGPVWLTITSGVAILPPQCRELSRQTKGWNKGQWTQQGAHKNSLHKLYSYRALYEINDCTKIKYYNKLFTTRVMKKKTNILPIPVPVGLVKLATLYSSQHPNHHSWSRWRQLSTAIFLQRHDPQTSNREMIYNCTAHNFIQWYMFQCQWKFLTLSTISVIIQWMLSFQKTSDVYFS